MKSGYADIGWKLGWNPWKKWSPEIIAYERQKNSLHSELPCHLLPLLPNVFISSWIHRFKEGAWWNRPTFLLDSFIHTTVRKPLLCESRIFNVLAIWQKVNPNRSFSRISLRKVKNLKIINCIHFNYNIREHRKQKIILNLWFIDCDIYSNQASSMLNWLW